MKTCKKCNSEKVLTDFHKHLTNKDRRANTCKECEKIAQKERYKKDPDFRKSKKMKSRERYRKFGKKRQDPDYENKRSMKYKYKYPEKVKAVRACENIKAIKDHKHHWSYKKEHRKDVIHLTIKDHYKAHRFLIYDQERMMYRKTDGVLLDTKERHEEYIFDVIKNKPD